MAAPRVQRQHQVGVAAIPLDLHADAMPQSAQKGGPALRSVAVAIPDSAGGWCYDDYFHGKQFNHEWHEFTRMFTNISSLLLCPVYRRGKQGLVCIFCVLIREH
jgi:hypothetical protein